MDRRSRVVSLKLGESAKGTAGVDRRFGFRFHALDETNGYYALMVSPEGLPGRQLPVPA